MTNGERDGKAHHNDNGYTAPISHIYIMWN